MANGKEHAIATRRNAIIVTVASLITVPLSGGLSLAALPGIWLSHFITPDFDLSEQHPIFMQRRVIQRLWLIGWLLWLYWYPYGKLCGHRGRSHSYPFGTLVRLVYTLWPIAWALWYFAPALLTQDTSIAWGFLITATFLTWSINDWTHLWMDTEFYKRHFRNLPHQTVPKRRYGRWGYIPTGSFCSDPLRPSYEVNFSSVKSKYTCKSKLYSLQIFCRCYPTL